MISGRTPGATALLVLSSKSESLGTTSPIVFISLHRCCVCYLRGSERLNPEETTWRNAGFVSQATQGSTQTHRDTRIHTHWHTPLGFERACHPAQCFINTKGTRKHLSIACLLSRLQVLLTNVQERRRAGGAGMEPLLREGTESHLGSF